MEILKSLCTKIFTKNYRGRTLSSTNILGRSDVRFLRSLNVNEHLFYHQREGSLTELVASCDVASDAKLQECVLGEQILLVGSDPIIGSWDSSIAISLNWSDGYLWSVEIDMPIDLSIQYKFILKGSSGDLLWQPGPGRIFRTWETKNTIIIAEDWENAEFQKITEEKNEGLKPNSDLEPAVFWNASELRGEPTSHTNEDMMFTDHIADAEVKTVPNSNNAGTKAARAAYPSDRTLISANKEFNVEDEVISNKRKSLEDEVTLLLSYEEGPVLVPGLTPPKAASTEEEPGKSNISDASVWVDAIKNDHMMP